MNLLNIKLSVLFLGGFSMPAGNAAARRVLALIEPLLEQGCRVDIVGQSAVDHINPNFIEFNMPGARYLNVKKPITFREKIKHYSNISELSEVNFNEYNVVVCYNYPFLKILNICIKRKRLGFKLFLDLTEWYSADNGGYVFRLIKWMDTSSRMRFAFMFVDKVIVASSYLFEFYDDPCKVTVVPTLVQHSVVEKLETKNGRLNFVYSGTPFDVKCSYSSPLKYKDRLDVLVGVFLELPTAEYTFNIVGITLDEYLQKVPGHESMLRGNRSVKFIGRCTLERSVAIVASADYSIYIRDDKRSNRAGFPTKMSESFSVGTPVLTNSVGDASRYLCSGCGVILSRDPDVLKSELAVIIKAGRSSSIKMSENIIDNNPLDISKWSDVVCSVFDV